MDCFLPITPSTCLPDSRKKRRDAYALKFGCDSLLMAAKRMDSVQLGSSTAAIKAGMAKCRFPELLDAAHSTALSVTCLQLHFSLMPFPQCTIGLGRKLPARTAAILQTLPQATGR